MYTASSLLIRDLADFSLLISARKYFYPELPVGCASNALSIPVVFRVQPEFSRESNVGGSHDLEKRGCRPLTGGWFSGLR